MKDLAIRRGRPEDAVAIARLTTQLGYPSTERQTQERMARLETLEANRLLVAETAGQVVGWIHLTVQSCLEADPWAEVLGLVVDAECRGRGVGRELLCAAEAWTREHGPTRLRLRTNVTRDQAQAFYETHGFRNLKTQHVFVKDLEPLSGSGELGPKSGELA